MLDFRRVLIVQRRVQESVVAHGGDGWRRRRALSQTMDAMVQLRVYGWMDVDVAAAGRVSGERQGAARWRCAGVLSAVWRAIGGAGEEGGAASC